MVLVGAGPLLAAAVAPLLMTLGCIVWGEDWKGSPFSLNMFKCGMAGSMFVVISVAQNSRGLGLMCSQPGATVGPLIVSSILGIVIGDNAWLAALQVLGARKVILVDSLKPLLSVMCGAALFNESLTVPRLVGAVLTCGGIAVVCLERETDQEQQQQQQQQQQQPQQVQGLSQFTGFVLAFANVALDVFGSVLTRQAGKDLTTWEINAVRFGFAALALGSVSLTAREVAWWRADKTLQNLMKEQETPWWDLPLTQPARSWRRVSCGVILVTLLCPALSNWALFYMPLGLALTLGSIGPVYAVFLDWARGKPVSTRAAIATLVCTAGVALLFVD